MNDYGYGTFNDATAHGILLSSPLLIIADPAALVLPMHETQKPVYKAKMIASVFRAETEQ